MIAGKLYSTQETATKAGIHKDTLLRWLREGRVAEPNRDRNDWRMFRADEVKTIIDFAQRITDSTVVSEPVITYVPEPKDSTKRLQTINWDFDDAKTGYLTHSIHPYPAKYIPQIPRHLIRELASAGETILDPFCGSGTSLAEALRLECNAIGIDANPLACLISRAKTTRLSADNTSVLVELGKETIRLGQDRCTGTLPLFPALHPLTSENAPPPFAGVTEWFDQQVIDELAFIKSRCLSLPEGSLRDLALTAFSSIIVTVSRQDSDTRYVRREKNLRPGDTLTLFGRALANVAKRVSEFSEEVSDTVSANVYTANILHPPDVGKVDLMVCSPPYPNAYSYHLYHRTRMLWLGMDQPLFKQEEIGSHRKYSSKSKNAATVETFRGELAVILNWLRTVLRPNRHACFVIGDSILNGIKIENDQLLIEVAQDCGFQLDANLNRTIKSSKKSFNPSVGKIRDEHIVILRNLHKA